MAEELINPSDLAAFNALLDYLEKLTPPSREQIDAKLAARRISFIAMDRQEVLERIRMASRPRALEFLSQPNAKERLFLIKNDLGAQVRIVSEQVTDLIEFGESIAPGYSQRVGVILRKAKRKDLSQRFEAAIAPLINAYLA